MKEGKNKYCNCLYYSATAFSRVMSRIADEEFAGVGLSSSYAFLLMTVVDKPGIQPKEISEELQLAPSTVTRLIEKLEYQGYLERKSVGRSTEVYATEKVAEILGKVKKAWSNINKRYVGILGKEAAAQLTADINEAAIKLE